MHVTSLIFDIRQFRKFLKVKSILPFVYVFVCFFHYFSNRLTLRETHTEAVKLD